jgi:hypothetical protein
MLCVYGAWAQRMLQAPCYPLALYEDGPDVLPSVAQALVLARE